jgi:hypothetical protein
MKCTASVLHTSAADLMAVWSLMPSLRTVQELLGQVLELLGEVCPSMGEASLLRDALSSLDDPFMVVVVGEFNSGAHFSSTCTQCARPLAACHAKHAASITTC